MPEPLLQPVSGDPFLEPVSGNPFSEAGIVGDVGAAQQKLLGQEAARRATVEQFAKRWTLPGRVVAGVQPETPGMWSEADEFRRQQLEAEAQGWGPEQAAAMIKGGVPMAQRGAVGVAGGKLRIKPSEENLTNVVDANFSHGRVVGNRTVPIESLQGGVSRGVTDQSRVDKLAEQRRGPEGYIERLVVDDAGNVIEGQHRLDALKKLGVSKVPVTVIKDLERGFNINAMKSAIKEAGIKHPDQVHQMMGRALNSIHEEGSPELAAQNTSIGGQWEKPYQAAIGAAHFKTQPVEGDPFGGT